MILTPDVVDELLMRIEKRASDPIMRGPPGTICEMLMPIDALHELLLLWKVVHETDPRNSPHS
jgi:hypothetical protein